MVTVALQVRDVHAAIYLADRGLPVSAPGSPPSALPAQLFHEVFATLIGGEARLNFHAVIDEAEPELDEWSRVLIKHCYQNLVGPRLLQHQAVLHHLTDQILTFWDAAQEMCQWLAEQLWRLREAGDQELMLADSPLGERQRAWELHDPEWSDAVLLTGAADGIWKIPDADSWSLIELRTERTTPEADLAQACLYHGLISNGGRQSAGPITLVSFAPERHESLFTEPELARAQPALKRLIGRLAGVLPETDRPVLTRPAAMEIKPEHLQLGQQLVTFFRESGLEIKLDGELMVGPAFLRFPVAPGSRVKARLTGQLAREIQSRLRLEMPPRISAESGRMIIDLQRQDRQTILFSQLSSQLPEPDPLLGCAQAPLGVDLTGQLRMIDFTRPENAHLLVAGMSGSGRSEWLRAVIAGLIVTNTPATLRLLIIDSSRENFHPLRNSPYLYRPPVIPDQQSAADIFRELVDEMDRRYRSLNESGDESLSELIRRAGRPIPRIFCICDEYADLIAIDKQTRKAIEQQIVRLGQYAHAVGIHLIISTRQSRRQVIKGVLDSNLPARVGLKMQKAIESKMLLNYAGAETLLGRGDLLFKDLGEPIRLQGAHLPPAEANRIFNPETT